MPHVTQLHSQGLRLPRLRVSGVFHVRDQRNEQQFFRKPMLTKEGYSVPSPDTQGAYCVHLEERWCGWMRMRSCVRPVPWPGDCSREDALSSPEKLSCSQERTQEGMRTAIPRLPQQGTQAIRTVTPKLLSLIWLSPSSLCNSGCTHSGQHLPGLTFDP